MKALEFIINILSSGVGITSGSNGFPLIYDLLTGVVPLKLHPNDSSHNWGRLFTRLLPVADFQCKKAEMSVLRLLSENHALASHPNLPKYEIDGAMKKFKGVFSGKDAVSRLMKELHEFLSKDELKSLVHWAGVQEEYSLNNTIVLKPAQVLSPHRSWIVPRITNFSRSEFYLDINVFSAIDVPLVQLKAFCSKPLALIKLDTFVRYLSRGESRLSSVSREFPFDVSSDKASKTHCSARTMQRLYSDVQKYADKTNSEQIPTLIGFSDSDIDLFYQNNQSLIAAQKQLASLVKVLTSCMQFDRSSLRNLMKRALAICNSDERSDEVSTGREHECNFMRHRLGKSPTELNQNQVFPHSS